MQLRRFAIARRFVPALHTWLTDPLWDQFAALLPERPMVDPTHPLGCHRRRISDRIIFEVAQVGVGSRGQRGHRSPK